MDFGLAVGIIGTVITIASFVYAIIITQRSKQAKNLKYQRLPPSPIAGAISKESGYSIKIVYESPHKSTKTVDSVFVQYLRFTNFGKVPITKNDSAKGDPLRVEVKGGKVLDITLANATRDVCRISLGAASQSADKIVANINFEFLDYLDGGLVQVVTEGEHSQASLCGTIIGMPQGLIKEKGGKTSIGLSDPGCIVPIIIQVCALIAVPFIYQQLNGSWDGIWFLLLPVAALILPIAFTIPFLILIMSRKGVNFPERLSPPSWYESRLYLYNDPGLARRDADIRRPELNDEDAT
jgi:hypothetical protein